MMWRLFYWTDSLIIGFYNSATEVGIYNAAVPLAFLLSIASQLFLQLFFPLINKEYSLGNKETVKQLSKQLSKWTLALNLPILIILLVFPEFLINLLFGPEFLGATNALRILAIGGIFSSLAEFPNRLITSSGRSKIILIDITIITILNIFLNLFLVPKYGITGAATATMISFIVLSFTFTFQSIKYLSVFPIRRKMLNILLAAAVSTTGLIYFKSLSSQNILSFLLLATFFTTFYVLLIYLFRGLDKNDFMILRSATKFSKRLAKPPNK
jgi:O-antigen/teichoic acid export membrane protein